MFGTDSFGVLCSRNTAGTSVPARSPVRAADRRRLVGALQEHHVRRVVAQLGRVDLARPGGRGATEAGQPALPVDRGQEHVVVPPASSASV